MHPAYSNLHLALCNALNVITTKISHVIETFKVTENIKVIHFTLKTSTGGILVVLILYLDLNFWNSDPKIHIWENLGRKNVSCPLWLKIGTHGIWRMLILIPTFFFWIYNPKSIFGQIWAKKNQSCLIFMKVGIYGISRTLIFIPTLVFPISKPKSIFGKT